MKPRYRYDWDRQGWFLRAPSWATYYAKALALNRAAEINRKILAAMLNGAAFVDVAGIVTVATERFHIKPSEA